MRTAAVLLNDRRRGSDNADSLVVTLREASIRESDEVRPGLIADFGDDGGVVGFEMLRASRVVENAGDVQFATVG